MERPLFRKRKKVDWFRALIILGGAGAFIYVAIALGKSNIGWILP
jgi:hypothetical protein